MHTVSIIINNYNYGQYLAEAIASALAQTYPAIEVIVVDDGSTDNSREIIAAYGKRIKAVLKSNGGQGSALNAGFAVCQGDIVIFLDADDVLLPDIAYLIVEAFLANPGAAKVQYRMQVIDAGGRPTGQVKPSPHTPLLSGDLRRHYLMFPDDVMRMATSGNAFAAGVLGQIFPVPEQEYRAGADTYLAHLTPLFGPVISLQDVGASFRIHGANNFEVAALNLVRTRRHITHSLQTHRHIKEFAHQLGLYKAFPKADNILSVSFISKRVVSFKLAPQAHPIQEDNMWRLFRLAVTASFRRFDVSLGMKLLYVLWFAAMAVAPKPVAHWLAEQFAFPEKRRRFNKVLGALQYGR